MNSPLELAKLLLEQMKIMDASVKEIDLRMSKAKQDSTKTAYADYKRSLRDITGLLYALVGKMRVDRVLDPPEIQAMQALVDTGFRIGLEERSESEF